MVFNVKITAEDGSVIELGTEEQQASGQGNFLTDVNIYLNSKDDKKKEQSPAMLAKIEIFGEISNSKDKENNPKPLYKALFDWAKALNKSQWYRTVDIEIKEDGENEETFRKYHFEKVFVIDYKEFYGKSQDGNFFQLYLKQLENNFKYIEAY